MKRRNKRVGEHDRGKITKEQRQGGQRRAGCRGEVNRRQGTEAEEAAKSEGRERNPVDWSLKEFQRAVRPYRPIL